MTVHSDLTAILATAGEPVTLPGGAVVRAVPGVATTEDALSGDAVVSGRTRTLRFASPDVATLSEGQTIAWNSASWRVLSLQLTAMGHITRAFLGAP